MADDVLVLADLKPEDVPEELRPQSYFDFQAHPFAHQAVPEGILQGMVHGNSQDQGKNQVYDKEQKDHACCFASETKTLEKDYPEFHSPPPCSA